MLFCLFRSRIDLQVGAGSASCLGLWEEGQPAVPTEATIILLGGCDSLHSDCTCSSVSASILAPFLGSIPARKRCVCGGVVGGCLFCSFCTWFCRLLGPSVACPVFTGVCCLYWLLFPAMFSTPSLVPPTSSLYFSLWSGVCSLYLSHCVFLCQADPRGCKPDAGPAPLGVK